MRNFVDYNPLKSILDLPLQNYEFIIYIMQCNVAALKCINVPHKNKSIFFHPFDVRIAM